MSTQPLTFGTPCPICGASTVPDGMGGFYPHYCTFTLNQQNVKLWTPAIEAVNDQIAVEPFKNDLTEVVQKGTGFNTMKGATTLTGCKVVFGNKEYPAGQTVYVRAELAKDIIGKTVLDVEGTKVTFIPVKEIRLVKRYDPNWNQQPMTFTSNQPLTYGKLP
jgi:hypothetical protein